MFAQKSGSLLREDVVSVHDRFWKWMKTEQNVGVKFCFKTEKSTKETYDPLIIVFEDKYLSLSKEFI